MCYEGYVSVNNGNFNFLKLARSGRCNSSFFSIVMYIYCDVYKNGTASPTRKNVFCPLGIDWVVGWLWYVDVITGIFNYVLKCVQIVSLNSRIVHILLQNTYCY